MDKAPEEWLVDAIERGLLKLTKLGVPYAPKGGSEGGERRIWASEWAVELTRGRRITEKFTPYAVEGAFKLLSVSKRVPSFGEFLETFNRVQPPPVEAIAAPEITAAERKIQADKTAQAKDRFYQKLNRLRILAAKERRSEMMINTLPETLEEK